MFSCCLKLFCNDSPTCPQFWKLSESEEICFLYYLWLPWQLLYVDHVCWEFLSGMPTWEAESIGTPRGEIYYVDLTLTLTGLDCYSYDSVHLCINGFTYERQKWVGNQAMNGPKDYYTNRCSDFLLDGTERKNRKQELAFYTERKTWWSAWQWIRLRHANEIQKQQWQPKWVWGLKAYFRVH